ncbi:hypothetical protein MKJ01_02045 [Chryseobacterium sp. SSA4.19]|uniref:hypothetical protein n=1 Tax=Chryseobacterium sp. SSA4.19 TaxID=2919915 RepID=UPI001F4EC496|nr:hypothetical protein [Chryseobacterium sp. SSA4.19]MCJ8152540.1 hypothetical protein [Chryseobacterium sp. SSA4.19]
METETGCINDMKIYVNICITAILLFLNGLSKAQKPVNDTLVYLKKFETNKEKYIGKPFSLLLKDMVQLQPKKAKSDFREDLNNPLPNTSFTFSQKEMGSRPEATLSIRWKADDSPTAPIEFFEQEHNYFFTLNERNFFEKKIIKDIIVYKK